MVKSLGVLASVALIATLLPASAFACWTSGGVWTTYCPGSSTPAPTSTPHPTATQTATPTATPTPLPIKPELSLALIDQSTPTSLWGPSNYTHAQSALRIQIDAVNQFYQTDHRVVVYNFGDTAPATAWPIYVRDACYYYSTQVSGVHWVDSNGVPYACAEAGGNVEALIEHEASEMLADPFINGTEIVDTLVTYPAYLLMNSYPNPTNPVGQYHFDDFLLPTPQNGFTDYLQQVPQ